MNFFKQYYSFAAEVAVTAPEDILNGLDTEQLLRLFNFGLWASTKQRASNSLQDVLGIELESLAELNLTRKPTFQVSYLVFVLLNFYSIIPLQNPQFQPLVLDSSDARLTDRVRPSVTDSGLCAVVNGRPVSKTYKLDTERMRTFVEHFEWQNDTQLRSVKIKGSGSIFNAKFLINMRNPFREQEKGTIYAALNQWPDFFAIRSRRCNIHLGIALK